MTNDETLAGRVRQIYELAAQKPVAARAAFLERVCGGDSELRSRVESLLAANEDLGDFLAEPTGGAPVAAVAPPQDVELAPTEDASGESAGEASGDIIDRYKLLQQIGEGGMGTVWMAEQFEPVRRKVALKIIKLGMDTKQVVVRFEAERQALALMEHASIAKVLDGGVTVTGRPYFVMELVKGMPITEFCDNAKFDIRQRLELFTDVCTAIQHAHQKGIIHRDIKPTNVLVTLHDGNASSMGALKVLSPLAMALQQLGRHEDTENVLKQGIKDARKAPGQGGFFATISLLGISTSYVQRGMWDEALASMDKADAAAVSVAGLRGVPALIARLVRGQIMNDMRRSEEAVALLWSRAWRVFATSSGRLNISDGMRSPRSR